MIVIDKNVKDGLIKRLNGNFWCHFKNISSKLSKTRNICVILQTQQHVLYINKLACKSVY